MIDKPFKPYIVNAFYNWALENHTTPYINVSKSIDNVVPEYLKNNASIILRLHNDSVYNLVFSADNLYFLAYFNGEPFQVCIPYSNIRSIFCKETNYSLNFDIEENIYEQKNKNNHPPTTEDNLSQHKFKVILGGKESK